MKNTKLVKARMCMLQQEYDLYCHECVIGKELKVLHDNRASYQCSGVSHTDLPRLSGRSVSRKKITKRADIGRIPLLSIYP